MLHKICTHWNDTVHVHSCVTELILAYVYCSLQLSPRFCRTNVFQISIPKPDSLLAFQFLALYCVPEEIIVILNECFCCTNLFIQWFFIINFSWNFKIYLPFILSCPCHLPPCTEFHTFMLFNNYSIPFTWEYSL